MAGYAVDNVLEGVVPDNAKILFRRDAQRYAKYLNIVRLLHGGVIHERAAARAVALHSAIVSTYRIRKCERSLAAGQL